jgi:hypothetical protein
MDASHSARFRLRDLLLLAGSSAICLALLEIGLRLIVPIYDSPYRPQQDFLVEIGPHSRKERRQAHRL